MPKHQKLQQLLTELQQHLITESLHSSTTPSTEALASVQPFCVDSLEIEQWLQFVMLPKFQQLIDKQQPLPRIKKEQGIANIAELVLQQRGLLAQSTQTITTIKKIDLLLEE